MTRLLFQGGTVFDAADGSLSTGDVVVEHGKILEVGTDLDGDRQIDCTGLHVLPGLFDTHVHVMLGHIDMWRMVQTPFSYRFFEAARNLEATIRTGITTVRDGGGADLGIKKAVDDGLIEGPRLHVSLGMLSQTGGHGDGWFPSGAMVELFPTHPGLPETIVDGVDEMRSKVRELVRAGADVIKVATSGGVLSPRDDPRHAHFRLAELRVLVEEATAAGIGVMAHAQGTSGIKNAIRAGIRSIEHGIYLDEQAIEMMLERGTYLVPTLVAPTGVLRAAEAGAQIPEASLIKAREVIEAHQDSFRRAVEAGVKIAMGTDTGVTPHGENLAELALMVKGGMTPEQALVATTRTAAELMGLDDELGTIEPGKRADLVLVDGDPRDVATLSDNIAQVWKDGCRVV